MEAGVGIVVELGRLLLRRQVTLYLFLPTSSIWIWYRNRLARLGTKKADDMRNRQMKILSEQRH